MKRLITIVMALILALSLASFAACGPEEEGPDGEVKITFMHMWPEHEAVMNQLLDQFEAENEGITVEASITPYDQIEQVLQAAQISGTLPNVYTFYTHYMTPMVSSTDGVMAGSLNELHDEIIGDFIQESSWELGKINGTYYSAPFRATGELIFYNKTLFGEKGWNKPETFEAFEALLDAVSADGTYTPLAAGGKEHQITYLINAMSLFCSVMDGSVDEPGYAVGRLEPDESDNTSVLIYEKVHDWYAADYFGKGAIAVSKQGAIKEFTSRRAAMVFANVNNLGDIATLMPNDEIGVFAIPAPSAIAEDVKYVYGGYDGLSYNPGASDAKKEASLKLIKFLVSAEVHRRQQERGVSQRNVQGVCGGIPLRGRVCDRNGLRDGAERGGQRLHHVYLYFGHLGAERRADYQADQRQRLERHAGSAPQQPRKGLVSPSESEKRFRQELA